MSRAAAQAEADAQADMHATWGQDEQASPLPCQRHAPIETGFAFSYCQQCQVPMRFVDWEWKEDPRRTGNIG